MERRAVRVSHEFWKQMMTQGYTNVGIQCVRGLPEDAELVEVWVWECVEPDPVFVFESDSWGGPAARDIQLGENVYPECIPVFRTTECRTCKWWGEYDVMCDWAECKQPKTPPNREMVLAGSQGVSLKTMPIFGCTLYEPRETDA